MAVGFLSQIGLSSVPRLNNILISFFTEWIYRLLFVFFFIKVLRHYVSICETHCINSIIYLKVASYNKRE